ncbi:MAG: fibrobacter succinogenes major paralogous domain-containing protein [Bacteroidales bacterium]|nr:fibrobacter succinogenes major paralogous domain-containing protein [Bacteroidales bacterium]
MKNMENIILRSLLLVVLLGGAMTLSAQKAGETVKDADGNEYKTVVIGSQTWMAENLKTTKYANGNSIKNVTGKQEWVDCKSPAYCWYDNNSGNKNEYGALYNWYAINAGNICPKGWHVATDADWNTLENKVGGRDKAAQALREEGTKHWKDALDGANNDYGFNLIAGGFRNPYGDFTWQTVDAGYWTATGKNQSISYAWNRTAYYYDAHLNRHEVQKCIGYSVRCVKD